MSEIKKLELEELKSIQDLQKQYNQVIFDLGSIESQLQNLIITESELTKEKKNIISDLTKLVEKEKILIENLQQKYGNGNINPVDGTITPF